MPEPVAPSTPVPGDPSLAAAPAVMTMGSAQGGSTPDGSDSVRVSRPLALAVVALSVLGFVLSAWLWLRLSGIQEQLARQSADSGAAAVEARALAKSSQDVARETAARQAVMETRLSEVALQRSQLEELMQSLSRSRDENLLVDIESAIRLAQQQSQLTGSVEPLLAALRSAELRVGRAAQPRLNTVQRAITRDIERIKSATVTDVPALLVKLDELSRMIDELTLANQVANLPANVESAARTARPAAGAASAPAAFSRGWWMQLLDPVQDEARKLVRISRIDTPEAALLSPEQSFFLRENLKLKLLNARLGVIARQFDASRADLAAAQQALTRYFDPGSRRTQAALALLAQVQAQMKSVTLPRVDETLAALSTAAAGR